MQETRPADVISGTPVRHPSDTRETVRKPKLLDRLRESLQPCHYSRRNEVLVRDRKGAKERITMFPESLKTPLQDHLKIQTVQKLLGHSDVKTAMIYTHVPNRGPAGGRSPFDGL